MVFTFFSNWLIPSCALILGFPFVLHLKICWNLHFYEFELYLLLNLGPQKLAFFYFFLGSGLRIVSKWFILSLFHSRGVCSQNFCAILRNGTQLLLLLRNIFARKNSILCKEAQKSFHAKFRYKTLFCIITFAQFRYFAMFT